METRKSTEELAKEATNNEPLYGRKEFTFSAKELETFRRLVIEEERRCAEAVAWSNMQDDGVTPCLLSISQHPEDRANWMNPAPLFTFPPAPQSKKEIRDFIFAGSDYERPD